MPPPIRHIRVFLSSPGDVAEERALARDVLEKLPYDPFLRGKVTIEVVAWDQPGSDTPLLATLTPQEAINQGLPTPSKCDIVAVIFWSRMGTPLPFPDYRKADGSRYLSGTEWEYLDAFNAASQSGRPLLVVYRSTRKVLLDPSDTNFEQKLEQSRRVKTFFEGFVNPDGSIQQGWNEYGEAKDFGDKFETHIRDLVARILNTETPAQVTSDVQAIAPSAERLPMPENPFPGLRELTTADAPIFFGRDDETNQLVRKVLEKRFAVVVGGSGSGKSSLVGAGLLPRLKVLPETKEWLLPEWKDGSGWVGLRFTPGEVNDSPFLALGLKLAPFLRREARDIAADLEANPAILTDLCETLLKTYGERTELLMFIDQFEELFTRTAEKYRAPFVEMLAHAMEPFKDGHERRVCLRIVITLRSDFYQQCVEYAGLSELLRDGSFTLAPPSQYALYAMIVMPAERARLTLEDGLPERIVEDTGADLGALPLMSYTLEKLYERAKARGERQMLLSDYDALGGVQGVIAEQVRATLAKLKISDAPAVLHLMFRQLVQVNERDERTRKRAAYGALASTEAARRVVDDLIEARLLTATGTPGDKSDAIVELAHDSLLRSWPELDMWVKANIPFLLWQQELERDVKRWKASDSDKPLLSGKALTDAEDWLAKREADLSEDERAFIRESIAAREARIAAQKRQRRLMIGLIAGIISAVMVILAILAAPTIRAETIRQQVKSAGQAVYVPDVGLFVERYEVTNGRYRQCVEIGKCAPPAVLLPSPNPYFTRRVSDNMPASDSLPVVGLDALQAEGFCEWINRRLPKNEEWEAIAFGTDSSREWPWGNEPPPDADHANLLYEPDESFDDQAQAGRPEAVGGRPDGAYQGIEDLIGNVSEWTGYWSSPETGSSAFITSVVGGNFLMNASVIRQNLILEASSSTRMSEIGFRCVEAS